MNDDEWFTNRPFICMILFHSGKSIELKHTRIGNFSTICFFLFRSVHFLARELLIQLYVRKGFSISGEIYMKSYEPMDPFSNYYWFEQIENNEKSCFCLITNIYAHNRIQIFTFIEMKIRSGHRNWNRFTFPFTVLYSIRLFIDNFCFLHDQKSYSSPMNYICYLDDIITIKNFVSKANKCMHTYLILKYLVLSGLCKCCAK